MTANLVPPAMPLPGRPAALAGAGPQAAAPMHGVLCSHMYGFLPWTQRECGAGRGPAPGTWPVLRLSNIPAHTYLPAPRPTSAKLAAWPCQPLTHLPTATRPSLAPLPVLPTPLPKATEPLSSGLFHPRGGPWCL